MDPIFQVLGFIVLMCVIVAITWLFTEDGNYDE